MRIIILFMRKKTRERNLEGLFVVNTTIFQTSSLLFFFETKIRLEGEKKGFTSSSIFGVRSWLPSRSLMDTVRRRSSEREKRLFPNFFLPRDHYSCAGAPFANPSR